MKNLILDHESPYRIAVSPFKQLQILTEDGNIQENAPAITLTDLDLKELMRRMVFTRNWDIRAMKMSRQGRLGFYAPVSGQEATMIGSSYALRKQDWILPGYRDIPQIYWHGYPMYQAFLWSRGHQHGGQIPPDVNVFIPQIIIGAQYIQAAGVAMGLKKKKTDQVVITYTGDGGSSEGDFYEALNFAGVYSLPLIFIVQNNGYAISTPRHLQTAAESIAQKGIAAGIRSVQIDGMDVLAAYQATNDAIQFARQGEGPTLIEAVNYRMEPHSMSGDDPSRYRSSEEGQLWQAKDPLNRFRTYLTNKQLWTEEEEAATIKQAHDEIAQAISKAESYPKMTMSEIIDSVYKITPNELTQQKEWFTEGATNSG